MVANFTYIVKLTLASMSILVQCFAAKAGIIGGEKMDITRPPLTDILVKYVFELRTTGGKKFYQDTVSLRIGF